MSSTDHVCAFYNGELCARHEKAACTYLVTDDVDLSTSELFESLSVHLNGRPRTFKVPETLLRGLAISCVGVVNSTVCVIVQFMFPWQMQTLGPSQTFLIYGVLALAAGRSSGRRALAV